ncbi:sulfotransferase [Kitasatospora purpeofusca]|uniref:sulfotransferase family protein n=1 Tax=Kitasatospora purpeofusca TaxID=67352 RepID=UPI00225BD30A|nr:sulfotransferase [Kitasatospora purpeofusca]MCX4690510.1 sulfotransferase [Kitasatospora purpeofusca]
MNAGPVPGRALSEDGHGRGRAPVERLDAAALRAEAVRRTGLADFGAPGHGPALDLLVQALETEARLSPAGRAEARDTLLRALCTRLWLHALPEPPVRQEPPVVLVGLPRTGSTLLHRLLAHHPALRPPRLWELLAPVTPPGVRAADLFADAERHVADLVRTAPDLARVHPTGANEPEECEHLMNTDFRNSVLGLLSYRVPTYASWLAGQDLTAAYTLHRAQLAHILARRPAPAGSRLVLKSPSHLWHLPALDRVHPGARFVVLERGREEAIGSVCGLVSAARRKRSEAVDPVEIGRDMTAATHAGLSRMYAFTTDPSVADRCLTVRFADLVADPDTTARRVVDWLGLTVDGALRRRWHDHLSRNPRPEHVHPREACGLPPAGPRPASHDPEATS